MAVSGSFKRTTRKSLRTSMQMFVGGLILVASVIFIFANTAFGFLEQDRDVEGIVARTVESYAVPTRLALETDNEIFWRGLRDTLHASTTVSDVIVSDASGQIVIEKYSDRVSKQLMMSLASDGFSTATSHKMSDIVFYTQPVYSDQTFIGSYTIGVPIHVAGFDLARSLLLSLSAISLILALAIPASVFVIQKITAPLKDLTDFASRVSANKISTRVDIQTGNEFEALGDAFNSMMQRIEGTLRQVQKLAFVDPITGLPNRESFMRNLNRALQNRNEENFTSVIVFNVDRFRWVNETLGPEKADQVLSLIGMRIRNSVKKADAMIRLDASRSMPPCVARLGGDEFAVLIPDVESKSSITRLMQLVVASMRQPLEISGQAVTLGLSGGISLSPIHGLKPEELLKNADLALKEARRSGRGKTRFYSSKLNQIAMDRLHLEADLRKAIDKEEFVPYFQPKVCFKTGKINSAEALVRWKRADGDLISPGIFIPMAEQLGLISKIGDLVMKKSCQEAAEWMRAGHDCKVAVNVSPLQFEDSDFSDKVLSSIRNADLPPGRLELEITETMAVADTDRVSEIMRPLRAMGVRLAIDDFGAGHSNLVTLTRLPFDVFKIDQQFVSALHSDKQAPAIVEMILAMAQTMGLDSVAEGVETPAQADFLRQRNCTLAQGFLYSKPLPPTEFAAFLETWTPFGREAEAGFISEIEDVA